MLDKYLKTITHPDMADWLVVIAYLIVAIISYSARSEAIIRRDFSGKRFWGLVTAALIFFSVNELIDMQTMLTIVGRDLVTRLDWYADRHQLQIWFVTALGVLMIAATVLCAWLVRREHAGVKISLAGLAFVAVFITVRASAFHRVNEVLGIKMPLLNLGSWQELGGAVFVGTGAIVYLQRRSRPKR